MQALRLICDLMDHLRGQSASITVTTALRNLERARLLLIIVSLETTKASVTEPISRIVAILLDSAGQLILIDHFDAVLTDLHLLCQRVSL